MVRKYEEKTRIGINKILFIERIDSVFGNFKCDYCGKIFKARIGDVACGRYQSCGCQRSALCRDKKIRYYPGQELGRYKTLFVERIDGNKGIFKCSFCDKLFVSTIKNIANGKTAGDGCLESCFFFGRANDLRGKRFGKLLVVEPTSKRIGEAVVWRCECDCGNKEYYVSSKLLSSGDAMSCGCLRSKGELKILSILEENKYNFIQQKTFDTCKNSSGYLLRFDFYLPDYNCCIEYDGEQHFRPVEYFGGEEKYIKQKENDKIKNNYCNQNQIKLIRIPFSDYDKINKWYLEGLIEPVK